MLPIVTYKTTDKKLNLQKEDLRQENKLQYRGYGRGLVFTRNKLSIEDCKAVKEHGKSGIPTNPTIF